MTTSPSKSLQKTLKNLGFSSWMLFVLVSLIRSPLSSDVVFDLV